MGLYVLLEFLSNETIRFMLEGNVAKVTYSESVYLIKPRTAGGGGGGGFLGPKKKNREKK